MCVDNGKGYKIYIYTNKINNKKYVGQTCRSLSERAQKNGSGYKKCRKFWNAIQKYGWENFESEILYDGLTKDEANQIEIMTISELQTQNDKYGYNICEGGNLGNPLLGKRVVQLDFSGEYIATYESIKQAVRECHANPFIISNVCNSIQNYENAPYKQSGGYIWMWELDYLNHNYDKKLIVEALHKEFVHPNAKPVVQLSLNMEYITVYKNISDAARKTGLNRNGINDVCTHKLTTSGEYIWMYEEEYKRHDFNKEEMIFNAKRHGKQVVQLDLDMNFVNLYPSTADAARETRIDRSYIADTCKGRYSKAKGYRFMYANDYYNIKQAG